jgi:hypothetical protein
MFNLPHFFGCYQHGSHNLSMPSKPLLEPNHNQRSLDFGFVALGNPRSITTVSTTRQSMCLKTQRIDDSLSHEIATNSSDGGTPDTRNFLRDENFSAIFCQEREEALSGTQQIAASTKFDGIPIAYISNIRPLN